MPSLSDATKPRDTSNLELITREIPVRQPAVDPSADPEFSPLSIAPIPAILGTDTDAARQFYRRNVSQLRMPPLPPQSKIAIGASGASQALAQKSTVTNITNITGETDGLTHGQTNVSSGGSWESDPAYIILRDDFTHNMAGSTAGVPITQIGQLGWNLNGTVVAGVHGGFYGGTLPNLGQFWWDNSGSVRNYLWMNLAQNGLNGGNTGTDNGWPLFDNPGWQMTWVFRLGGSAPNIPTSAGAFGAKAMYVGLAGTSFVNQFNSGNLDARPDVFFGVRYDTSGYPSGTGQSYSGTAIAQSGSNMTITGTFTGANTTSGTSWVGLWFTVSGTGPSANIGVFICTAATTTTLTLTNPQGVTASGLTLTIKAATPMVLTAAANGNGAQVVYTGTIFAPVPNNFVGQKFFVSGFGNSGNNGGPWLCTANTTTTITLANPVSTGSAETHAGYVGGPLLADNQLFLEVVQNPSYFASSGANFTQGTALATGIVPTLGIETWHRLDIVCNSTGKITLTLDGTISITSIVTAPTITIGGTGLSGTVTSQQLLISYAVTEGSVAAPPWAAGSQVTITGFAGAQAGFNSTFPLLANRGSGAGTLQFDYPPAFTVANSSVNGTLSGFPSVFPIAMFGNDNNPAPSATTGTFFVDFFSFVWNPNLGPNAPGTPDPTKARYW